MHEFLHRHPSLETMEILETNHVVVDRDDWEKARQGKGSAEQTTHNTGSPKLLGFITYALDALRRGDYESVEPYLVRASEQLRAGA